MLALVERALAAGAKHLTLEVRITNSVAQGLYDRFGFDPVGRRKNYYKDEDALVMWATDIDTPEYAERLTAIRETLGVAS
jgi:ribosomal-protein-alanine N-acetyltransferase